MNSPPMRDATNPLMTTRNAATTATMPRFRIEAIEQRRINPPRAAHEPVFVLLYFAGDENRDGGGDECDRQHGGTGKRHQHGERHRREHLAFDAGQREHRQVDDGDDHHAEQARSDDFARAGQDGLESLGSREQPSAPVLLDRQQTQAVLDDDDRAVDDDAEIDGAQAHQVGADLVLDHAGDRDQHRQRNDAGCDDRGANVSEQEKQDSDDEQRALDEVLLDCGDRCLDQDGTVVDRARDDTFRQGAFDFLQLRCHALGHAAAVFADQQHGGADDRFLAVQRSGTGAQFLAFPDLGHIADADRHALVRADDDVPDFGDVGDLARRADEVLLAVPLDVSRADICVVGCERRHDIAKRQLVRHQPGRIGKHVKLLLVAADGVDLDDAGHRSQLRLDDPVLNGPQVRRRCKACRRRSSRPALPRPRTCRFRRGRSKSAPSPFAFPAAVDP